MSKYFIFLTLIMSLNVEAAERNRFTESYYSNRWCIEEMNGITEFVLPNKKRVDCVTDNFAIEADWATRKTYEGIGQSLDYAKDLNKIPGLFLIIKDSNGMKWVKLAKEIYKRWNINAPVWYVYAVERYEYK